MRFLIGITIGLAIGLAAAILFAPDKSKLREASWFPGSGARSQNGSGGDSDEAREATASLKRALRSVQDRANEAMEEAKKAAEEAEKEMRNRFERMVPKSDKD